MNTTKNKLVVTTPSDLEIVMTRDFDAPAALVFEVFTQPEHVKQWWGCSSQAMPVCDIDLRVGGAYRYVFREESGVQHPFIGVYREIQPPTRLVHTQIYDVEPYNAFEAVVTLEFTESGGKTTMKETIAHATKEARDGHLMSGMEEGAALSLDRVDDLLAKLQS
jgi:uncharacterized protein YndB with AHSA1/START domain